MAQFIPLPNELIRKIYGYIHPAFEYQQYVKDVDGYNDTKFEMCFLCKDHKRITYNGNTAHKLNNVEEIAAYASLQYEYLKAIHRFIELHPRFVRPSNSDDLAEYQYKRQFDTEIVMENMKRLDKNNNIRRGMWMQPDEKTEILLFHDINKILFHGTTRDIIYSCIINNVRGFKNALKQDLAGKIKNDKSIVAFINRHYSWRPPLGARAITREASFRKRLIRKLMKL